MELNKDTGVVEVTKPKQREITPEDMEYLRMLHEQINGIKLCKNEGCKNIRANGSSRCKECSDKFKNNVN